MGEDLTLSDHSLLILMAKSEASSNQTIREFFGSRQSNLFRSFKQSQFTGKLTLISTTQQEQWYFYLGWGRILYATGGVHPIRRWLRNIRLYAPNLLTQQDKIDHEVLSHPDFRECWEYYLLRFWLEKDQVSGKQVNQIIRGIIVEIFFDLSYTMEITFDQGSSYSFQKNLMLFDADQLIAQSWQHWQKWRSAKLADRSPNQSPLIHNREQLQQLTSPKTYKMMTKFFNGENSLRDLSLQLQQNLISITKLIIPYLQLGLIDLINIDDSSLPGLHLIPKKNSRLRKTQITIACVSHQFSLIQEIEQLVTQQGYSFVSYSHSQLALTSMLTNPHPPQFIFLDFDLQDANIYRFSAQLRNSSLFFNVPIIVTTNSIDVVSKWRGKMSGANDFLLKPINKDSFNQIIKKYLTKPDKKKQ